MQTKSHGHGNEINTAMHFLYFSVFQVQTYALLANSPTSWVNSLSKWYLRSYRHLLDTSADFDYIHQLIYLQLDLLPACL